MKFGTWCAAAALCLGPVAPLAAQELPKWLVDAKAREAAPSALVDVTSEDGWLRTKLPGEVRHKVVLENGGYSINILAAEGVTVSCEVLRDSQDLAALLFRTAAISFEGIAKLNGTIDAKVVEASDAGAAGAHPFLSLQWMYRASRQGEARVGGLKQFAAIVDDTVVYCAHDDLGYTRTFETVTRALVVNLRTAVKPTMQTSYQEVSVVSLDGNRVGVTVTRLGKDADGDIKVASSSAMLLQSAPGQLIAQDVSDVQWVRPDGSLINASQAKADNGSLSEDMALQRGDGDRWRATGKIHGKPIDVELLAAPSSHVQLAWARRALMAGDNPVGATREDVTWSSLDLTRLLPTRATVLAAAGPDRFAVREELGGMVIEAVLDRNTGTMTRGRMPLGPRVLEFERIFQQGAF